MKNEAIGSGLSHPAFSALSPFVDDDGSALAIHRLNALAAALSDPPVTERGAAIRFVRSVSALSALEYERRILATGCVPMRPGSVHDAFNALAWIAFPRVKRACNAMHAAHAEPQTHRRGPVRDAITLFDESGVIALCAEPVLGDLIARRQWKSVFWERRAEAAAALRFVVCGHALLDKLRWPYPTITGRVLIIGVEPAVLSRAARLEVLRDIADAHAAERVRSLMRPAMIPPLPLAGIPGWDARNADPAFYEDRSIFRDSAAMAVGSASTDSASAAAPAASSSSAVP